MIPQHVQDYCDGKRPARVPFVVNDTATILRGVYATRSGAVVCIDISEDAPKFLIEFGDGTDELVPFDNLEKKFTAEKFLFRPTSSKRELPPWPRLWRDRPASFSVQQLGQGVRLKSA